MPLVSSSLAIFTTSFAAGSLPPLAMTVGATLCSSLSRARRMFLLCAVGWNRSGDGSRPQQGGTSCLASVGAWERLAYGMAMSSRLLWRTTVQQSQVCSLLVELFRLPAMLRMVLLACCLFSPATAMFAVPEAHVAPPICVGKFPWRVAPELRLLHESVDHGRACTLLSPFSVMEDKRVAVSPEDSVDDVRVALSGSEPAWSRDIMPVWPTPAPDHMVLVPVAPADSLACVLIVTPEWQLPMLVPCRADVAWVLAYLRSVSPGAVVSIRGPLSL